MTGTAARFSASSAVGHFAHEVLMATFARRRPVLRPGRPLTRCEYAGEGRRTIASWLQNQSCSRTNCPAALNHQRKRTHQSGEMIL